MPEDVRLRLYLTATSVPEQRARKAAARLAEREPSWDIEVIDVEEHPEVIELAGIQATRPSTGSPHHR